MRGFLGAIEEMSAASPAMMQTLPEMMSHSGYVQV